MNGTTKVRHDGVPRPTPETAHAVHLFTDAGLWLAHALRTARMRPDTVRQKALDALAFSFEFRARSVAIPTKLAGTSRHQDALVQVNEIRPLVGHRLTAEDDGDALVVRFEDLTLGHVQDKHVPWLRPLLPYGATIHYLCVSGTNRTEGFYGLNVAIANVAVALRRLGTS